MRAQFETAAGNPENQDRGAVIENSIGLVMVVADGAGGQSGGAEAATMVIEVVRQQKDELLDASSCVACLQSMDQAISRDRVAGETTCALAVVAHESVYGASVGDSAVWVINQSGFINLTERQSRKPFVGSGGVWPSAFEYKLTDGDTVLLATDGLLKHLGCEKIAAVCRNEVAPHVPRTLNRFGALPVRCSPRRCYRHSCGR